MDFLKPAAMTNPNPVRETALAPDVEVAFRRWLQANQVPYNLGGRNDYDMRGFYQAAQRGEADSGVDPYDGRMHYPDRFKLPGHPTFSGESQHNPSKWPQWRDGRYLVDQRGQILYDAAQGE